MWLTGSLWRAPDSFLPFLLFSEQKHLQESSDANMEVSRSKGTPKSSTLMVLSLINHPFGGTPMGSSILPPLVLGQSMPSWPEINCHGFACRKTPQLGSLTMGESSVDVQLPCLNTGGYVCWNSTPRSDKKGTKRHHWSLNHGPKYIPISSPTSTVVILRAQSVYREKDHSKS